MDINWQIATIAIRMKRFYKNTGRKVRVDGKFPVSYDKQKSQCFNCNKYGHFARDCTSKRVSEGRKTYPSPYPKPEAPVQENSKKCLLTMEDGGC